MRADLRAKLKPNMGMMSRRLSPTKAALSKLAVLLTVRGSDTRTRQSSRRQVSYAGASIFVGVAWGVGLSGKTSPILCPRLQDRAGNLARNAAFIRSSQAMRFAQTKAAPGCSSSRVAGPTNTRAFPDPGDLSRRLPLSVPRNLRQASWSMFSTAGVLGLCGPPQELRSAQCSSLATQFGLGWRLGVFIGFLPPQPLPVGASVIYATGTTLAALGGAFLLAVSPRSIARCPVYVMLWTHCAGCVCQEHG